VTIADLDEDMKVVHLDTWFEYVSSLHNPTQPIANTPTSPMDMFRQIAREGNETMQRSTSSTSSIAEAPHDIPAGSSVGACPMSSMSIDPPTVATKDEQKDTPAAEVAPSPSRRHSRALGASVKRWMDSFRGVA
jgi:hypothetical protein